MTAVESLHRLPIGACLDEAGAQVFSEVGHDSGRETASWRRDGIVARIVWVFERYSSEYPFAGVGCNHMTVHVPVLILEEGVVEMVRSEGQRQRTCGVCELLMKVKPLCRVQLRYSFPMAPKHPETLTQQILITVQHQTPVDALRKYGRQVSAAQSAGFHFVHGNLSLHAAACPQRLYHSQGNWLRSHLCEAVEPAVLVRAPGYQQVEALR